MANYILRGTKLLLAYRDSLGPLNVTREQIASALNLPVIKFASAGLDGSSYVSPVYTEPAAQALAALLGVTVANVTTNGGQEVTP